MIRFSGRLRHFGFKYKFEARKQIACLDPFDHPQEARPFCAYKYLKVSSTAL